MKAESGMLQSKFDAIWHNEHAVLSAPDSYSLEFIEPNAALAPLITTFFSFRSDEEWIRDCQPANTGYMMVFLSGKGQARFDSGNIQKNHPICLIGPTNAAMQYVVEGPFYCFGCAFTPIGWRAVTDMPAGDSCDRLLDGAQIWPRDVDGLFHNMLTTEANALPGAKGRLMADLLGGFLATRLADIPPRHIEIISAVVRWLDQSITPDVDDLYRQMPLSERQAQRVINDYFGCAPKQLMRKYRAVRAAMLLNDPACSKEDAARVHDLFYDQPHMIREIRHFAGRTPSRLSNDDGTLLSMWLDKNNIRELRQ
jgi:AraC-like DNA-binding protein